VDEKEDTKGLLGQRPESTHAIGWWQCGMMPPLAFFGVYWVKPENL
jgi:hypothetical protein